MNDTAKIAIDYKKRYGFSVIPVTPSSKEPWIFWEKYQSELATDKEIEQWWEGRPNSMVGLVTGKLSGIDIVDVDGTEAPQELIDILGEDLERIPGSRTPRGGRHYYFKHKEGVRNRINIWNVEGDKTKVDIRGEGGYAVLPPSCNGVGKKYKWILSLENEHPEFPEELLSIVSNTDKEGKPKIRDIGFSEGSRNENIFHAANSMKRGGMPQEEAKPIILQLAGSCDPPLPEREALASLESAYKRKPNTNTIVSTEANSTVGTETTPSLDTTAEIRKRIREWARFEVFPGSPFHLKDAYPVVNAITPEDRGAVSKELSRQVERGILDRPIGASYGSFRRIDDTKVKADYKNATIESYDIKLPFDLDNIITLSPSDLIVVAGESGSGKTSFALELIKRNLGSIKPLYLSSELTAGKMAKRLLLHEDITLNDWDFDMEIREHDFSNAIDSDRVNIIDFIVTTEDFWKAAHALREIHNKMLLGKGLCFTFLQKGKHKEFGYGGDMTQTHAALYLTISKMTSENPNYLRFVKVREYKDTTNDEETCNPLGKVIPFNLFNSWKFKILSASPIYQDDYEKVEKNRTRFMRG